MRITHKVISLAIMAACCGCGPSPKATARKEFRDAVAQMKAATLGCTYSEFHRQRLALEAIYDANRQYLGWATNYARLQQDLKHCDVLFEFSIHHRDTPKPTPEVWYALTNIQPYVAGAAIKDNNKPDYLPTRVVPYQLAEVSRLCGGLLAIPEVEDSVLKTLVQWLAK